MMGLDVQQNRRYHANNFLSTNITTLSFWDEKIVQTKIHFRLTNIITRNLYLPPILVRVPAILTNNEIAIL